MASAYLPTWNSLRNHPAPQWFRDAKFGIYTHWGVYAVPARGPNSSWYAYYMYREGRPQYEHHLKTYGHPSQFGYKDFIPQFTAEKFDPDEWAEQFKQAGAQFAGPVGEHHDGFAMWDTRLSRWSAAKMGPKRDVVGELERAIRQQGLRFMVALHHAENWWFFQHWRAEYDTADPRYADLYGELHNEAWGNNPPTAPRKVLEWALQDKPSQAFLETWLGKTKEVIDKYRPDYLWFDYALGWIQEHYKREMVAYYYNRAREWNQEVVLTYKGNNLVPGSAMLDLELTRFDDLTPHDWISDITVDDGRAWGYADDANYISLRRLVHYLIDNVSKNGMLLLNVGPKANGEFPEPAKALLTGIGQWLRVNGEAIYGTTPWLHYGEGPTQTSKGGHFMEEQDVPYTAHDIRFTARGETLYAICLGWPEVPFTIEACKFLYPGEITRVSVLGSPAPVEWSLTPEGLRLTPPAERPGSENAFTFKIERSHPFDRRV